MTANSFLYHLLRAGMITSLKQDLLSNMGSGLGELWVCQLCKWFLASLQAWYSFKWFHPLHAATSYFGNESYVPHLLPISFQFPLKSLSARSNYWRFCFYKHWILLTLPIHKVIIFKTELVPVLLYFLLLLKTPATGQGSLSSLKHVWFLKCTVTTVEIKGPLPLPYSCASVNT